MRTFLTEFYDRRREVRRYMAVLRFAEAAVTDDQRRRHAREANIFKAAALLVLYNAIEASARSAIQAIYDELNQTNIAFEALHEQLRRRVLRDFKANAQLDKHESMQNVAIEMVVASFNHRRIFNGNVDAREIKRQSKDYGFDTKTEHSKARNGEHLLIVKDKRNDLAHGVAPFSEIGKQYTIQDLLEIQRYSLGYMEGILGNINTYLDQKCYLKAP